MKLYSLILYSFFSLVLLFKNPTAFAFSIKINDCSSTDLYSPDDTIPANDELLASYYFQNKEFEKAAELYENIFKKKPAFISYNHYLSCLIELKEFNKAHKIVKKQLKQNPDDFKYMVDIGYIYKVSGDVSKANTEYDKVLKSLNNYNPQNINELANAFLFRNETNYAIETYKKGKIIFKSFPYHFYLADIYEKNQNFMAMMSEYVDLLEINDNYLMEIQNKLQLKINEEDADNTKKDALKTVLLKKIQSDPDKIYYSKLLLWLSIQMKDFQTAFTQAKSLDKRTNAQGELVYNIAVLATSNADYEIAGKSYEYIISKGKEGYYYYSSRIELLNVLFLKITSKFIFSPQEIINLEEKYNATLQELGRTATTIPLMKNLAHLKAFYMNNTIEAVNILNEAIEIKNASLFTMSECKIELADILLYSGDVWEATLLYMQVEKAFKNDPIGFDAKLKNAKLYYYIGQFEWAKSQLDVLKASTSKLIANDAMELSLLISDNIGYDSLTEPLLLFSRADLLFFRNQYNRALLLLDSITFLYPGHPLSDDVLYKTAQIKMKTGLYAEVDTLLNKLIANYPYGILADKALFQLAGLYEIQLKNKEKAMDYYQKLITDYPASIFTVEARKKYRLLRGDIIN